jgi:hypothetical protein
MNSLGNKHTARGWVDALSFIGLDEGVLFDKVQVVVGTKRKLAGGVALLGSLDRRGEVDRFIIAAVGIRRAPGGPSSDVCDAGALSGRWSN